MARTLTAPKMAPALRWALVSAPPVEEVEEAVEAVLLTVAVLDPVAVGVDARIEETLIDTGLPDC